jgi:hypothetical protein
MKYRVVPGILGLLVWFAFPPCAAAERINQEGRILGPLPVVTNAILFDTNRVDAVVSNMQIFPVTNPWNECISNRPVLSNSAAMIAQIVMDLHTNRAVLTPEFEMNYVLVPDSQPLVPIHFLKYPEDSDLNGGTYPFGLYPIPTNMPIESWPVGTGSQTLYQWQTNSGGDRHSIVVQPGAGFSWETWEAQLVGTNWQAANGAIFNLNTNGLRPAGLTSGDAAGFPMFPALVRYDEAERGLIEHACRLVVAKSLKAYIYPATHYASSITNGNYPAMGQRLRLKSTFTVPPGWTKEEKAVLAGLKKYGAMVADNGNYFSISITPDDRWPSGCFNDLTGISATNFEVIQTTSPNEGPRSPGAPVVNAGPDRTVPVGAPVTLSGAVAYSNPLPVILWKLYSGPGTVTFGNSVQTNTTATFSAPGVYTLELSADDGVHAVAYDAAVFTVTTAINLSITVTGTNVNLSWTGGTAPFVVQETGALSMGSWNNVLTTNVQYVSLPLTGAGEFFRVQGQ